MLHPSFKGLPIVPSRTAMNEMTRLGMDEWDILQMLEEGYNCYASKRKEGTLEKCINKGNKTIKAVVVRSHNWSLDCDVWVITHVGKFSKRR